MYPNLMQQQWLLVTMTLHTNGPGSFIVQFNFPPSHTPILRIYGWLPVRESSPTHASQSCLTMCMPRIVHCSQHESCKKLHTKA